jgi:hypothetical protein
MRKSNLLALIAIAILSLGLFANVPSHAAAPQQSATEVATLSGTAAADAPYTVESVEELPYHRGSAFLSPDGSKVAAVQGGRQLCIYTVASKEDHCTTEGEISVSVGPDSVAWSPDSKQVAFTENFFQMFLAAHVWVLDTATMQVTKLSGGPVGEKYQINPTKNSPTLTIDVSPRWSPDGKQIFFLRCEAPCNPRNPAGIYSIDIDSHDIKKVVGLQTGIVNTYAYDFSKDGSFLVYINYQNSKDDPANGIWKLDLKTQASTQLARVDDLVNVMLSADETYALGYSPIAEGQFTGQPVDSGHRMVSLKGGGPVFIDAARPAYFPGWGPTGSVYAYIYRDPRSPQESGLYVVGAPGQTAKLVYPSPQLSASPGWRGIQWASDNSVLVWEKTSFELLHLKPQ